jgi:signal transduction histidine kinase
MRRRLVLSYGSLLAAVVLALAVPLAVTSVRGDSQQVVTDRITDAAYLAAIAEPALRTGESQALGSALRRYDELYGICAVVVDADGRTVARSRPTEDTGMCSTAVASGVDPTSALRRALAGDQVGADTQIWPWGPPWLLTAVPVRTNAEVIGVVVTVSPTARLRASTVRKWAIIGVGGSMPLALCVLAAVVLARWTLRPVGQLDTAVRAVAAGKRTIRAAVDVGPPELRWLSTAFNQMADTVSDTLARQGAFVSQAGHQLRNPLTALLLRLEALGAEPLSVDGAAEHRLAVEEVDLLQRMLEAFLVLAGVEGGGRPEVIDAVAVATARIQAWLPLARERQITLCIEAPPDPVPVHHVVTGLEQTLDVLLDNALKFGARVVTVRVIGQRPPRIDVIDDGRGLSPDQLQLATERFWRAPDVQNVTGYGFGLSIAKTLTEAAGGSLRLHNADGGGLRVQLILSAAD